MLSERRASAGAGDVGTAAVGVDNRLPGSSEDRLAPLHVALHAAGRGVVVHGQRAEDGGGPFLTGFAVGLLADELSLLKLWAGKAGFDGVVVAVQFGAHQPVALLQPAGGAVDADAYGYDAELLPRLPDRVPELQPGFGGGVDS